MYQKTRMPTSVTYSGNKITIHQLNHPKCASDFLRAIKLGNAHGHNHFEINVEMRREAAFPNACVPISGIIEYFNSEGNHITYGEIPEFIEHIKVFTPLSVYDNQRELLMRPLNKVWIFENSEQISSLVDSFIDEVYKQAECETGVIEGLTWCLNEVMDNVLQHSLVSKGFVMGQIHKSTKHIAFCIFDYGQGIFNSLRFSQHSPRNPLDAITLAVKEGITRDNKIGQGNGMWGLHNIVRSNSGTLSITSNSATYMLKGNEIRTFQKIPIISSENGTTIVDFQIDFNKGISISESLGGHNPINLRLESLETSTGEINFVLSEKSSGTGTRQSGERIRNEIINIYHETKAPIILDFSNISVISSSFADELIGKLVSRYGFFGFNQVFKMKNMNSIVQSIINRSVSQRMADTFAPDKYGK